MSGEMRTSVAALLSESGVGDPSVVLIACEDVFRNELKSPALEGFGVRVLVLLEEPVIELSELAAELAQLDVVVATLLGARDALLP